MSRHVDFRGGSAGREKRRVELPAFDPIESAVEIHFTVGSPEGMTDGQKLLGAGVPVVVREKVAVALLLQRGTAGDNVEGDAATDQSGERVHLLHERRRLHQTGAVGDDELELLRGSAERAAHEKGVWLVAAERDQDRLDAGFLRVTGKVQPALHVRTRSQRSAVGRFDSIAGGFPRRLGRVDGYFAAFWKHPVESQVQEPR